MALMLSAHRNNVGADAKIPQEVAATLLEETVDTKGLALSTFNFGCDFLFFASDRFPNNQFGYTYTFELRIMILIITSFIAKIFN